MLQNRARKCGIFKVRLFFVKTKRDYRKFYFATAPSLHHKIPYIPITSSYINPILSVPSLLTKTNNSKNIPSLNNPKYACFIKVGACIKVDIADDFPHYKISKNFLVHILHHNHSRVLARVLHRCKIACGLG